jgi:hypothetical protein
MIQDEAEKPRDEIEGMLAVQMLGCHNLAMTIHIRIQDGHGGNRNEGRRVREGFDREAGGSWREPRSAASTASTTALVRRALSNIEATLREHPEIAERTADYFAGRLPEKGTDEQGKRRQGNRKHRD